MKSEYTSAHHVAKARNMILLGYARCGMTILNRTLAGDDRLICLSEINTKFVHTTVPRTPHDQLKEWYVIRINKGEVLDEIGQALHYVKCHKKHLIVRDWSFGSFVGCGRNNFKPTNTLNTLDDIDAMYRGDFVPFGMVRHPIDVWLSMNNSQKTFYDKDLRSYLNFINQLLERKIQFGKYEDFCADPKNFLEKIYKMIHLNTVGQIELSTKAIGDISFPLSSRGASLDRIVELGRRHISEEDKKLLMKTNAKEICQLLGYTYEF